MIVPQPDTDSTALTLPEDEEETRKKRICRSITPSPPSKTAIDVYQHVVQTRVALFAERDFTQFFPPRAKRISSTAALSSISSSTITGGNGVGSGQNRRLCLHVLCLKTKSHAWIFSSPPYVFERLSDGCHLSAVAQISTVLRDHANAVAFVAKRSVSEQSSQQTTRFPIAAIGVTELSQQLAVKVVIGLAGEPIVAETRDDFIASSSTSHFAVSAPSTLHSFDFLASAVQLANDEIEFGVISSKVPQTTDHVLVMCNKIVDDCSRNGSRVWFSIGLLDYLKKEPEIGNLLRCYGFTEYAASISSSLLAYARAVVGNRARREYETLREMDILNISDSSAMVVVDGTSLEQAAKAKQAETVKTLSKKRKQSTVLTTQPPVPKSTGGKSVRKLKDSSTVEFHGAPGAKNLEFLMFVFSSNQRSLLLHLISESSTTSESAARTVLNWQLLNTDVANDTTLVKTAESCAKSSRLSVMRLLRQLENQSPCISPAGVPLLRNSECSPGSVNSMAIGAAPVTHTLLACRRFNGSSDNAVQICWVKASQRTKTSEIGELIRLLRKPPSSNRMIQNKIELLSERALPIELSGLSRSRLHIDATIPVNASVAETIHSVRRQASEHTGGHAAPISKETLEPHTTPNNAIAVGIYISELVRAGHSQIHSKQTIEAVPLCHKLDAEIKSPNVTSPRNRPWILFQPLDISIHRLENTTFVPMSNNVVELQNIQVQLTMLGDSPIRVVDACKAMLTEFTSNRNEMSFLRQYRALLLFGGVQSATLSDFSTSVSCKEINQQIAGTSKIIDPDRHRRLFLTIHQSFVVHHSNIEPSFVGTPWEGVYSCFYDTGATASSGTNGASFISDGRRPAPVLMPDAQVDQLTEQMSRRVVMKVSATKFAQIPAEARSLPRATVPGLHKALNPLCFAFEGIRRLFGVSTSTCPSIQVLPMSPFTEAVSAKVGRDVAAAHRTSLASETEPQNDCLHRADNTAKQYSILNSRIFDSIRCRATQPADNVFASIETNAECVVLVMSMLVEIAIALSTILKDDDDQTPNTQTSSMETLFEQLEAFHDQLVGSETEAIATLCADAMILLNICMPLEFAVAEPIIELQLENIHGQIAFDGHRSCHKSYWTRAKRNWNLTMELAIALHTKGNGFNHSESAFSSIATIFENWTRGIWFVQSPDGISAPTSGPYASRPSPNHVRSCDVNGVWVDNLQSVDENGRVQRGAIFGVQMLQLNQLLQAMSAATHVAGVKVQLFRNEGSLLVRPSSYAMKRAQNGDRPSAKSISPVQSENDTQAFGTRDSKEASSRRQALAWERNNNIIFGFTAHFTAPLSKAVLRRGSSDLLAEARTQLAELRAHGRISFGELEAQKTMQFAAKN